MADVIKINPPKKLPIPKGKLVALFHLTVKITESPAALSNSLKWKLGKLLTEFSEEIEEFGKRQKELLDKYKEYKGNGQYASRMIMRDDVSVPDTVADEKYDTEFKALEKEEITFSIPQIPFSLVSPFLSGRDISLAQEVMVYLDEEEVPDLQ